MTQNHSVTDRAARRARWRAGNVAVMFGIMLPVAVGVCGLGADVGYWYYRERTLQSAADAAAYDGVVALKKGENSSQITTDATTGATNNGWSSTGGTITVNSPPTSGSYQNAYSVQVILTQNLPRFFSALYSSSQVPARASAVATSAGSVGCILALDHTANQAVTISGGSNVQAPHCDIVSDSNSTDSIDASGGATVNADCLVAVGTAQTSGANVTLDTCTSNTNNASNVADPYASVAQPVGSGTCLTVSGGQTDFYPGWYCHGLSVSWGPVTFHGSTTTPYVVSNGGLNFQAGTNATGTGVTFFVDTSQTLAVSGSAVISFSAPTSGTYAGILFFGSRNSNNGNNNISGSSSSAMQGAIYFPTQQVQFTGASTTNTVCTQIIADTVTISGTSGFNGNNCTGGTGISTINVADGQTGSLRLVQ